MSDSRKRHPTAKVKGGWTAEEDALLKRRIAACVLAQQRIDWEWLVLDDSPIPSAFMQELAQRDPRVRYWHGTVRQRIGSKRNQLIALAAADVIAHFDDDDHYGPGYLNRMVGLLQEQDADLVKLSAFYMLAPEARQAGQVEPGFFGYMDLNAKVWCLGPFLRPAGLRNCRSGHGKQTRSGGFRNQAHGPG
ncbi:MAG: hypothetical protein WDW38_002285 [Sanguina aurantia]